MDSNEQAELKRKTEINSLMESSMTVSGGMLRGGGTGQKGKSTHAHGQCVVIARVSKV